jgi:hypothetical protein
MQAGRLLTGELLFTRTQVFCKLNKPISSDIPFADTSVMFNFMIIAGKDTGKFVTLPDSFEGTLICLNLGDSPFLSKT